MKDQGDNAELRFMLLNHSLGYIVAKPFGDNAKYDLIIDTGTELQRIQVKSTQRRETSGARDAYNCCVCSGSKFKERYSKEHVDYVAVYVIPEDTWYKIPVEEIKGKSVKLYPHRCPQKNIYEKYKLPSLL